MTRLGCVASSHLVHDENRLDTVRKCLTQDCLGLHTNTFDTVDHLPAVITVGSASITRIGTPYHQSTVANAEGCRHLAAKVDMARAVNQVEAQWLWFQRSLGLQCRQGLACCRLPGMALCVHVFCRLEHVLADSNRGRKPSI